MDGEAIPRIIGMSLCAAALVAVKARAGDKTGTATAMEKLNHTCHDCHAVFNPDK